MELDASELFGGISSLTFSAEVLPYFKYCPCLFVSEHTTTLLQFYYSTKVMVIMHIIDIDLLLIGLKR